MKKTSITLGCLLILTLSSAVVYSQTGNAGLNEKSNHALPGDIASTIHFYEPEKITQLRETDNSWLKNTGAYAYMTYDPAEELTWGPCSFYLDDPGTITSLAEGTSEYFLSAGTWADGKWYGIEYSIGNLYEINPLDGSMTFIGSSGFNIGGLAWDGSTMYACGSDVFGTINLEDASAAVIGLIGNPGFMVGLACDAAGNIYGVDIDDDNLYSINKTTGAGTIVGPLGIDIKFAQDMEFDKNNDILYLAGYTVESQGALYTIDVTTGEATIVGAFENGAEIDAFAIPYTLSVFPDDIGIASIVSPASGIGLTDAEEVIVSIKNHGTKAQSNFDVYFILDDGTAVAETVTDTLAAGNTIEFTFATTVDLSTYGTYTLEACTELSVDEYADNDCNATTIISSAPGYCDASTILDEEWIDRVSCGSINNTSAWQAGVADFTNITTTIASGMSADITVLVGNPSENDSVTVWVDWNNDFAFQQNMEEEFILTKKELLEIFTGKIKVPEGIANGNYRMRVRLVRNLSPVPCGVAPHGEVEDYTVVVEEASGIGDHFNSTIQVYPNPVKDRAQFTSEEISSLEIYDMMGACIFRCNCNQADLSNMNPGLYFAIGYDRHNNLLYQGKIIKK